MSRKVTRAELEQIGENWFVRRNKLIAVFHDPTRSEKDRKRALILSAAMNGRVVKVILLLSKANAHIKFKSGGVHSTKETTSLNS